MGKKGKSKAGEGQLNGENLQVKNAISVTKPASKKVPLWKQPQKVFVPAIPKQTNTWGWPSLPAAANGSQKSQRSQSGGSSANTVQTDSVGIAESPRTDSCRRRRTISSSDPASSTFVLKYYTDNSVPANGSVWEHPPPPSMTDGIKYDTYTPDPRSWTTVPENAKWFELPSWAPESPCAKEIDWCTKKCAIAVLTPQPRPSPWAAVSTTVAFPTAPQQQNPNGVVAEFGTWGAPEPVVTKDPNAPNYWETVEVSTEPKEKFPTLVNWPFTGEEDRFDKLASLGLFVENYKVNVFKHPKNDQFQSPLIRLLQVQGVNDILLKMLWEHHSTVSALSRTSQRSWDVLMAVADIWDVTGGNYQGCEVPREKSQFSIGVAPVLVVTPTRDGEPINYHQKLSNMHKLSQSLYNFREFVQNIQFHHVPFLCTQILALLVPEMRKLRVLGVYNCELIHLCEGQELLNIIKRDRGRGCEHQVSLDFYPAYHVGPKQTYQSGTKRGERRLGEQQAYGVSWDDTGMYVDSDTRIAIWQEVSTILQLARVQGIDLESKHTMFRQWLDKSPCLAVEATLKVITNPFSELENVIAHVAYGEFGGRVDKFKKSKPGKVPNKPEGSQWMMQYFKCRSCTIIHLGVYFSYGMIRNYKFNDQDTPTCMACKLDEYLCSENDHYKREKRCIIRQWCSNGPGRWNTNNLSKFIRVFTSSRTQGTELRHLADALDILRIQHERRDIFHETDEIQRPINHQALGRRGHYGIRAPTVQEKEAIESGRIHREWDTFRQDRINGHGQPRTFRAW